MKTLGLIGGLSWNSTAEYYRIINEEVQKRRQDLSSAKLLLYSFNFQYIIDLQKENRWDLIGEQIIDAGKTLQAAGAEGLLFCANTTHRFADAFEKQISLPLIHIADATAKAIKASQLSTVALLGTKPTMQLDFYKDRMARHGIQCLIPDEKGVDDVHSIIFEELCRGIFKETSKARLLNIIHAVKDKGANGVILGCTELPLLIKPTDLDIPSFDTTSLHAQEAVHFILQWPSKP